MITTDQVERYREIIGEIKNLLDEANNIVHRSDSRLTYERARGYCHAQIACALDEEHDFLGSSMFTMANIADELEGKAEGQEEESQEDDD
jgi:hypothetical protein